MYVAVVGNIYCKWFMIYDLTLCYVLSISNLTLQLRIRIVLMFLLKLENGE